MQTLKEEYKTIRAFMNKRDEVLKKVIRRSNKELKQLSHKDMLDEPAKYLANICVELDAKYGVGTALTLNWMLDNYFEMEFERRVRPWLIEIYEVLKDKGCTEKNSVDLFKGLAFYVPHDEKTIFVHDWNGSCGYLVVMEKPIIEKLYGPGSVYVRRIWKKLGRSYGFLVKPTLAYYRKKDFSSRYNDCRDKGHVFTTKWREGCDYVIWDIGTPMSWFMAINSIWTALINVEASHGLSDPEDVQNYYDKPLE